MSVLTIGFYTYGRPFWLAQ